MWSLLRHRTLWKGIIGIALCSVLLYAAVNYWIMPSYTRHGVSVEVPDTKQFSFEKAAQLLQQHDLRAEKVVQRFNPEHPRDVVIDQNPSANQQVKPGRRVYLTINSGEAPTYKVPDLINLSRRQAINQIEAHQLTVGTVEVDTIPSPYKNTITRQKPSPGDSVKQGTAINLWISPGQSNNFLDVPALDGLTIAEADSLLLHNHLRMLLLTDTSSVAHKDSLIVTSQHPTSGTTVREGSEIRVVADSLLDPSTTSSSYSPPTEGKEEKEKEAVPSIF